LVLFQTFLVNIVYSNGNHYDALAGTVSDISLMISTAALFCRGRSQTLFAKNNLINLASDSQLAFPAIASNQAASASFQDVSKAIVSKRKADVQSAHLTM
jgi:hypothetical protein